MTISFSRLLFGARDNYEALNEEALRLATELAREADAHATRAEALASKLADALERERERYHALAQSLVPKAPDPLNAAVAQTFVTVAGKRLDEYVLRTIWAEVESLVPRPAPVVTLTAEAIDTPEINSAVLHALRRAAGSDKRLQAHLWEWVQLPEQRERMQTPTGLASVVDEIVRGKQRSA